jgi:hypothetical protein
MQRRAHFLDSTEKRKHKSRRQFRFPEAFWSFADPLEAVRNQPAH